MEDIKKCTEHDENCDCNDVEYELETVMLSLDDGEELECEVLDFFNFKGDDYIFLLPLEVEQEELAIYPYKYLGSKDEEEFSLELVDENIIDELMEEFYKKNEEAE